MDALHRLRWEQDPAGRLLVLDAANDSKDEAEAVFELFDATIRAEPDNSVRLLADLENGFHSPALTLRWKEAYKDHDRVIRKAAILGSTGGMKVVVSAYRFYLRMRGVDVDQKMRLFSDAASARAWLAEQP